MGKVLKRLQLQFFLILWISYSVKAAPYSKYGRTCRDIGCLPREVCTMAYDTCSFNQQEGTNCGRYPTCVKADKTQQPPPQQNTGPLLNPAPENTRSSNIESPPRDPINPNQIFGWPNSHSNPYPQLPPQQVPLDIPRLPDNRQVFPNMPNSAGVYPNIGINHPDLTPPPNVFAPYRPMTTTVNPNFLDQFFNSKQQRNHSSINNASLNLTFLSFLFMLIYRIANNFA